MDRAAMLVRRLAALPEPVMREVVLVEELGAQPPAAAVETLAALIGAAREHRQVAELVAVQTLAGALGRLEYELRAALYAAAKAQARHEVARLFFTTSDEAAPPPEPEQYVPAAGRALTLGERKAAARGGRRELVVALLADPDASVIRALLENPRLTENDVVAVAARRPARADVIRVVAASRWSARYHVKRALVMNPGTPVDLAVRLVPTLSDADRRLVRNDPNLPVPVRDAARGA